MDDQDRTASLMTPAKLAQVKPRASVSPADWLDQMATDAGHTHVKRLAELRADLQLQATKREFAPLAADLARVADALPQLDFGLLQQRGGLFARLSGKARSTAAEFAAQYDRIDEALDTLGEQGKALQGRQGDQASRTDMTLLEFEVEFRALEKIIEQGARWLQDMRNQFKTREAQAGNDAERQQIEQDTQRCELLVARLKLLRALSAAAHATHQQAQAAAARRATLVQGLQASVSPHVKEWRKRVSPLAASARDGQSTALGLEGPMDSHRELQLAIKRAAADCAQMRAHEKGLAENLEALVEQLQAAG